MLITIEIIILFILESYPPSLATVLDKINFLIIFDILVKFYD
jgi:hypothetical protein